MSLLEELEVIPKDDQIQDGLDLVIQSWEERAVGLAGVEAGLAFIEGHPELDVGAPGPLVHFAEQYHHQGYEPLLLRSFGRRPTPLTAWMMNRLINGTHDQAECEAYVAALEAAEADPATDADTRAEITHYLDRSR